MAWAGWRREGLAALLVGGLSAGASAQTLAPIPTVAVRSPLAAAALVAPDLPTTIPEAITADKDEVGRLTVPVRINGQGPFAFIVDTGADHTVISGELAQALNLPEGAPMAVHSTSGVDIERTAVIDALEVGSRRLSHITAPLLVQANLGAAGMLGIDALKDQRMVMDFLRHRITVEPSRKFRFDPGAIVVHARSRFGQLVLVDASVKGAPIFVILDSGSESSVGNLAFRRTTASGDPVRAAYLRTYVLSVTGHSTDAEFATLQEVKLGGITVRNLPVAFADLHTFARFDLRDEPAMLLGMDALRQFDKVTVDFGRRQVRFDLPSDVETATSYDSRLVRRW